MKSKIQMKGLQFNKEAVTKLNDDQISQLKGGILGASSRGDNCSCCHGSCNSKTIEQ
ncbi:class I lanthipeptide, partial [Chryseobacterium indologenes]|uniref:class I lanthipeptide n=2 Tax=Chryseobacterium indologenes TaxID=253 RepID=UPI0003E07532